ncbi:hypothetical protein [Kitasatospora sp. NPDC004289]
MLPAPDIAGAVLTHELTLEENPFPELSLSARFEELGKGRRGTTLALVDETTGGVPLVRTTSRYAHPAQQFGPVHRHLAQLIQERAALPLGFNNALVECYTNAYAKMGAHSDQALDLADGSHIAVFSCYEHPEADPPRRLLVESKESGDTLEVPLAHNGFVLFSVEANRRLKHRIVLDSPSRRTENRWLGVTFRTSNTLVRFHDGQPHLPQGDRLTLADEDQQRDFFRMRRQENTEPDFTYPPLTYTVSPSDLLPPVSPG